MNYADVLLFVDQFTDGFIEPTAVDEKDPLAVLLELESELEELAWLDAELD